VSSESLTFSAFADGRLWLQRRWIQCALGRSGVIATPLKREGDGATPAGVWTLRQVLWRADRMPRPATRLTAAPIEHNAGWCDSRGDPAYNRPVRLPYPASAESLWRDDHLYDVIVVLGYNDAPVNDGAGSAIFLHVARPDYGPTEGCVALSTPHLLEVLTLAAPGARLLVSSDLSGA